MRRRLVVHQERSEGHNLSLVGTSGHGSDYGGGHDVVLSGFHLVPHTFGRVFLLDGSIRQASAAVVAVADTLAAAILMHRLAMTAPADLSRIAKRGNHFAYFPLTA